MWIDPWDVPTSKVVDVNDRPSVVIFSPWLPSDEEVNLKYPSSSRSSRLISPLHPCSLPRVRPVPEASALSSSARDHMPTAQSSSPPAAQNPRWSRSQTRLVGATGRCHVLSRVGVEEERDQSLTVWSSEAVRSRVCEGKAPVDETASEVTGSVWSVRVA